MKRPLQTSCANALAATVAPEDLRCGDFVAVLNVTCEFPSFFWCCDALALSPHELVRLQFLPNGGGTPLKVQAICLPFVFVKSPDRQSQTIDLRRAQLVRLSRDYAQCVWRELRKARSGKSSA